jgi:fumarate reductase subunit D
MTTPPFDSARYTGEITDMPDLPEHLIKHPGEIKTFGILHWIVAFFGFVLFGGGSLLFINLGFLIQQALPQMPAEERETMLKIAHFAGEVAWIMWIQLACCCVLTILLCIAGFGLLQARDYGRRISLYYAGASILTKIVLSVLFFIYMGSATQRLTDSIQGFVSEEEARAMSGGMSLLNTIINTLMVCIYPVLVICLLNRKKVKDCLRGR